METASGLLKTQCIRTIIFHTGPYGTLADVEFAIAGCVVWFNNRRLYGSLGMLSPVEFEMLRYEAPNPIARSRKAAAKNPDRFTSPLPLRDEHR